MTADAVDPWAVIEAVFPKPPPPAPGRPAVVHTLGVAGTGYAQAALEAEAQRVVDAAPGTRNHTLNRAAFSLGQLVAGGALDEGDVVQTLSHAAAQAGLEAGEIPGTIASGLRSGAQTPRGVPEPVDVDGWLRGLPATPAVTVNAETGEVVEETAEEAERRLHEKQTLIELRRLRALDDAKITFQAEKAARTFREPDYVANLREELALPREPVSYAIDDLLPVGGNALLTAAYKSGKTTLITDLARAFVDGRPFLGRFPVRDTGRRIAIFNYELSRQQYDEWLEQAGIVNQERVSVLHLRGYRLPITAPSVEDWVVGWLRDHDIGMWIADPFARAAVGVDENSNTEVGIWLDTFDVIKQRAGVDEAVLPVHTGRAEQEAGQERARGATRLDDWADVRWLLTKDDEDVRFFRATGRDVEVPEEKLTYRDADRSLTYGGGDRRWVKKRRTEDLIVAWVAAHPGCSGRALIAGVGGNKEAANAARLEAIRGHRIRVEEGPSNSELHYSNEEPAGA